MPCVAPSEIIQNASGVPSVFGGIAESFIASRYLAFVKRANFFPVNQHDFRDANVGFSNVRQFIAFLKLHNPSLSVSQLAVLSGAAGLVRVPDLMTDDALRREYYEIKPNSPDGIAAGFTKIAALDALLANVGLGYRPGTRWNPDERHRVFDGSLFGRSIRADFHFFRRSNGLIVYEICVDGDLLEDLAKLMALIAGIILIIIARGRIPMPRPGPVPVPVA